MNRKPMRTGERRGRVLLDRLPWLVIFLMIGGWFAICNTGCNRNPYFASAPGSTTSPFTMGGPGPLGGAAVTGQTGDFERRLQMLDENNRQLTTQLAQSQQQMQLYRERAELLQRQLQDVAGQLDRARLAQNPSEPQRTVPSSTSPSKGGARLVANNSLGKQAEVFRELGLEVALEGDVVRISIPADMLFQPETAQLSANAAGILDRVASAISRNFARQRIAVEGHSDDRPFYGGTFTTAHQLTSAQSMAVLDQLIRRNGLPANQLFSLAHGSNHPKADNQSAAGRSFNRRIDLVIYPDTF